jgi:hypothetical protein
MKTRSLRLVISVLLLAILSLGAVSTDRLKAHVTWLADPAREGRYAGTPGGAAAADYIAPQLKEIGCDVQMQDSEAGGETWLAESERRSVMS